MKFWPAALALALIVQGCISNSPLHQAVTKGDRTKVATILQQGGKIDARDAHGRTALFIATENGDADTVKELLDHGANPTKGAFFIHGNTPLHVAAEDGDDKVVELILAKTNIANIRNSSDQTPLMLATWARHPTTVTLLIKYGADVGAYDQFGWTALHTPWDAKSADANYTSVMEILIANKAPVNADTIRPLGYTPLMGAAFVGDNETVELLLEHGSRVNDVDEEGQTAYSFAESRKYSDVLATLSERGGTRYNPITPAPPQTEPLEPSTDANTQ